MSQVNAVVQDLPGDTVTGTLVGTTINGFVPKETLSISGTLVPEAITGIVNGISVSITGLVKDD